MSQDQIQLPEPEELDGGTDPCEEGYGIAYGYTATTARRLIAEAVAVEREACAALCVTLHNRGADDWTASPTNECAAAIRARGAKT